ncbi:hypothetical protein HNR32_000954 [Pectinatus brassicae]|uniref:Uncharacterized protein n=1 Tax=Pectinatus brassicae TaxID=862415 RepID=A0A840UI18_9FIRM|nr:hypothetical protein [Pectinatus brassicae]MBB5335820.1 hypothetical protein [Pectinatus brassicae]
MGCAYVKIGAYPIAKIQFSNNHLPDIAPYYLPFFNKIATDEEINAASTNTSNVIVTEKKGTDKESQTPIFKF